MDGWGSSVVQSTTRAYDFRPGFQHTLHRDRSRLYFYGPGHVLTTAVQSTYWFRISWCSTSHLRRSPPFLTLSPKIVTPSFLSGSASNTILIATLTRASRSASKTVRVPGKNRKPKHYPYPNPCPGAAWLRKRA